MSKKALCLLFLFLSLGLNLRSQAQDDGEAPVPMPPAIEELYQKYPDGDLDPSQLKRWLEDSDFRVRYSALIRLNIKHPESLEILKAALKDSSEQIRKHARFNLSYMLGAACVPLFLERLESETFYGQIDILEKVEYFPTSGFATFLLKAWMGQTARDWQSVEDIPEDWLHELDEAYIEVLHTRPKPEMVEAARDAIGSDDARSRFMALNMLLSLKGEGGEDILHSWLQNAQTYEERLKIVEKLWYANMYVKDSLMLETIVRGAFTEKDKQRYWPLRQKLSTALDFHEFDEVRLQLAQLALPYTHDPATRLDVLAWFKKLDADSPLLPVALGLFETGSKEDILAALAATGKLTTEAVQESRLRLLHHSDTEIQLAAFASLAEHEENLVVVQEAARRFLESTDKILQSRGFGWLLDNGDPHAETLLLGSCDGKTHVDGCWELLFRAVRGNRLDLIDRLKPWLYEQDSDRTHAFIHLLAEADGDASVHLEPFFLHRQGYFSHTLAEIWRNRKWVLPDLVAELILPNNEATTEVLGALIKYPEGIRTPKIVSALRQYLQIEQKPYRLARGLQVWRQLPGVTAQEKLELLKSRDWPKDRQLEKLLNEVQAELKVLAENN